MSAPVKLQALPSMDGKMNIVYQRTDAPIMHVIVKAPGGTVFGIGDHFDRCPVCRAHGVTLEAFDAFMRKDHS